MTPAELAFERGVQEILGLAYRLGSVTEESPNYRETLEWAEHHCQQTLFYLRVAHGIEPDAIMKVVTERTAKMVEAEKARQAAEQEKRDNAPERVLDRSRIPPAAGMCKKCGDADKLVNRMKLCYRCWVNTRNEEKGWKEGQPHPADCGCELECRLDREVGNN